MVAKRKFKWTTKLYEVKSLTHGWRKWSLSLSQICKITTHGQFKNSANPSSHCNRRGISHRKAELKNQNRCKPPTLSGQGGYATQNKSTSEMKRLFLRKEQLDAPNPVNLRKLEATSQTTQTDNKAKNPHHTLHVFKRRPTSI